jgi:hypothetical protein
MKKADNFNASKWLVENRLKETTLTEAKYNEFMLEWMVPGKESNTLMSKNLKELFNFIDEKNINGYTVKGWDGRKWDTLISSL